MKRLLILSGVVGFALSVLLSVPLARAQVTEESGLLISQYKVTSSNGQFFELFNNTSQEIDMSDVQLAYYNHYDVSKATSSKLISLSGVLVPGGYYLVNDGSATLCYQTMVASASLSFSSTAGMVQVHMLQQTVPGGPISSKVDDVAAWSKTAAAGAQTLPSNTNAFLKRQWGEDEAKTGGGGSWLAVQPSASDPCQLETIISPQKLEAEMYLFTPGTLPPVRYVSAQTVGEAVNRNKGKMAPIINELLPNPASPQTDANDEFVEIYNPNSSSFDLSGFKLAYGSTSPRRYTFPEGTLLPAKAFKTFTSSNTSISLSNTLAQVWLLDPNDGVVSKSEAYSKAPSGQAWVLNNGKWGWTSLPTPGKFNAINGATLSSGNSAAAVLGITANPAQNSSATSPSATNATNPTQLQDEAPIHPSILVGVGTLAVGYALYEYRKDMANRIFQLRRYLRNRREARQTV